MIGPGKLSELAQDRCGWRKLVGPALQPTDDDDDDQGCHQDFKLPGKYNK